MLHNGYGNPFLRSSYHPGRGYSSPAPTRHDLEALSRERELADALAARRARRAQYLLPEDVDNDQEDLLSQGEKMYLETRRRQGALERVESERKMRETEAFTRRMEQEKQRAAEKQNYQRSQSRGFQNRSVPVNVSGRPPRESVPVASSSKPPVVEYTQIQHDAAEKIQNIYRRYLALKSIADVATQFDLAKNELVFPDSLEFVDPDKPEVVIAIPITLVPSASDSDAAMEIDNNYFVIPPTTDLEQPWEDIATETTLSALDDSQDSDAPSTPADTNLQSQSDASNETPTAQLAYTKHNYPVHAYMEKLNVLLMNLDTVLSYGSRKVRERRKEMAQTIEKDAARIEGLWKDAWVNWLRERSQQ